MVKPRGLDVEWTLSAREDLKEILTYYKKKSTQSYKLVKIAILDNVKQAANAPLIFTEDKLKKPKDNKIRAFTVYHIRVSYLIETNKLVLLRLRHTSREQKEY
ncbi:MAG TPA: type II toxin-antitoxin system RelE/ParE family toxin [Bacteroidia bacterium]|jgi:plasmid stabilization system protein ParE|nr:type II toxin-antitoxin system RelE/ParE family toxin [Bacteroidia bacterium]